MLKLVVCEKPSVAQSISKVLGATKRGDGFLEGGGYIVSWCIGHLVELAQPESYEERYAKWRKEEIPGDGGNEKTVLNFKEADVTPGCGESGLCNRCGARR